MNDVEYHGRAMLARMLRIIPLLRNFLYYILKARKFLDHILQDLDML